MSELVPAREAFGFRRTACACALCRACCRHVPGALDPSDLPRLCPEGADLFAWAEQHLRALTEQPYPALVPARGPDGACHWHYGGKCEVHADAPYGCAYFDAHMSQAEVDRRVAATVRAIREDAAAGGPYSRVWLYLRRRGLVARRGDRSALLAEVTQIRRRAERRQRSGLGE
jgi:hypothetical protein